jgi:DNA-binding CsgD family transcriptional regulator
VSRRRDNRWKNIKLVGKADGFTEDQLPGRAPPARPLPTELSEDAREIIEGCVARFRSPPARVPAGCCPSRTRTRRDDLAVRCHLMAVATGLGRVRLGRELGLSPHTVGGLMARGRKLLEASRGDDLS